jgi:hypothetical protein
MRSFLLVNRPSLRFLAVLPLLLAVAGCSTEPDVPDFFQVTYSLTNSSVGSVTELTYIDNVNVRRVVSNPSGDWAIGALFPAGQRIGATAEGIVQSGEIILEIRVLGMAGEFTRSDSCEESTGEPVACSLEIPEETL